MIQYFKPIGSNFEDMIAQLPQPIVILELWKDHKLENILTCNILAQALDSDQTFSKGICVIDFILKTDCKECNVFGFTPKMFFRRWEMGTHLIEEYNLPHYAFVAVPIDIEYKVLNISTNQNHIYVKGELVGI